MTNKESIQQALLLLENQTPLSDQAALVIMPPDSRSFLVGNREGYIRLATASLKAAQGETQTFKKAPWFVITDYDWPLAGLEYDESAQIHLPAKRKRNRIQQFLLVLLLMLFLLAIAAMLIVGVMTTYQWLGK